MVNYSIKPISTDLQYLMKHSVSNLTQLSPNLLSPVSVSFLSTFFHKIHNAYLKWNLEFNTILNTKMVWSNKEIPEYNLIPEIIQKNNIENITRETIYQKKFTLEMGGKTFNIMLWFPTYILTANNTTILMSDIQIQEKVNRTLQKIYMWLSIATSFLHKNTKCSKIVNIYLFLTDHKKILPTNEQTNISYINVNTAFTTGCIDSETSIMVYREEEWFKVFMHETMHNLGLDFNEKNSPHINALIHQTFPISVPDIRLYETYAEMWANIMNILFVVYFTDIPAKKGRLPIVRWTQLFTKRLYLEQLFSLFQATKILVYHKMKYSDLFVAEKAVMYTENTQMFCYYILKCIWIMNINSFLEFCVLQHGGPSLKFYLSQYNIEKYVKSLVKNAKSDVFNKLMNEMYVYYTDKKEKVSLKKISFAKNTLRMTLQEMY
jgi:hypothetical protein